MYNLKLREKFAEFHTCECKNDNKRQINNSLQTLTLANVFPISLNSKHVNLKPVSAINPPEKCSEEQLKTLFVLEDDISRSNAMIAKILRRHRSATFRDLKILIDKKMIQRDAYEHYVIVKKGHDFVYRETLYNEYNKALRVFVEELKKNPEPGIMNRLVMGIIAMFGFVGLTVHTVHASPSTSIGSTAITSSGSATAITKTVLAAIVISIVTAAGGGIIVGDAYYSDPSIEYSVYPTQLPAELHGVSLQVNNIYSTDDKSEIMYYNCDNEPIIHKLEYTFDCITENSLGNKETITTSISVKKPVSLLDVDATYCISQYYVLSDDMTQDYPYLLDLPNASPTYLSNLKQDHKKLMDNHYESHDYASAKIHATIVLKYFDANEVQTLSTMGNIIRDEDRSDLSGTHCAIAIHSTSHLHSTVWGKLSLAEDYHVLGNYDESIRLSSLVISNYKNNDSSDIPQISYANALTIKANALYLQALNTHNTLDEAKMHYTMAHDIRESYDTWFGLGNIDRHEGNLEGALEKYENAKLLVQDTDEIDQVINNISFISKKV